MKSLSALLPVLALLSASAWSAEGPYETGPAPSENQPAGSAPKLFQEVTVTHKSVARVQAIESRSDLRYVVLSSLATDQGEAGGTIYVVKQMKSALRAGWSSAKPPQSRATDN